MAAGLCWLCVGKTCAGCNMVVEDHVSDNGRLKCLHDATYFKEKTER